MPLSGPVIEVLQAVPTISRLRLCVHDYRYHTRVRARQRQVPDRGSVGAFDWWVHDLRRTAASGMARLGTAPHVVEKVLNHKSGVISGVAAVYNRFGYEKEKRQALDEWAQYLEHLIGRPDRNLVTAPTTRAKENSTTFGTSFAPHLKVNPPAY